MSPKNSLAVSPGIRANRPLASRPKQPTILIAEDSADSREMMQLLLESKGYRVILAENGVRALEVAIKNQPDAVMLDLQLPKLDGLSVTRNLRLHRKLKDVPIIIVSGHDPQRYRQQCLEAGSNEYFLKPIDFDRLQLVLDRIVPLEPRAALKSA